MSILSSYTRIFSLLALAGVLSFITGCPSKEETAPAPKEPAVEAPKVEAPAAADPAGDAEAGDPLVARGQELYQKAAIPPCITCHSIDGNRMVGPSFLGMYGTERELADGTKVMADDAFIMESIRNPAAKVAKDFTPAMTPYAAEALSDDDVKALIAYIKTLKG